MPEPLVFQAGNHIELLESGAQYFPALIAAIKAARQEVQLETYIFATDATAREVVAALADAARRDVAVRVLVDGYGARGFVAELGPQLVAAGAALEVYRPEIARLRLRRHRLRRLHRKLACIDGHLAFVGGINIIDDYDTPHLGPRLDYAVRIDGPLAGTIRADMAHLWRLVGWARLRHRPAPLPPVNAFVPAIANGINAAFLVRDNLRHRHDIEDAYLAACDAAREEIFLANAYFLPDRRFRLALREAAKRGVTVTLLLQGQVEYALLHYATQAIYASLLKSGIRIREYRAGFLHAKVAVVDRHWATVGSSNIDPFSLLLAREANVVIDDGDFARRLLASLQRAAKEEAIAVATDDLLCSPLHVRLLRWVAYAVVRLLLGFTRYGGSDYRE